MLQDPVIVKILVFTLAMLPLLIENWRKGTASNRSNAILVVGGIAFAIYQFATGALHPTIGLFGGWAVMIAISLGLAALNAAPGGVAKTFIALAPWLTLWPFVAAVAVGMIVTAVIGFMRRRKVGIAVPVYLMVCAIWLTIK